MPTRAAAVRRQPLVDRAVVGRPRGGARGQHRAPGRDLDVGERHRRQVLDHGAMALERHQQQVVAVEHDRVVGDRAGGDEHRGRPAGDARRERHQAIAAQRIGERRLARTAEARQQAGRDLGLDGGHGRDRPALLLGDQRQVEERGAPAAGRLGDRHRHDPELTEALPEPGIEPDRLGRPDVLGCGVLGVQAREGVDELGLFLAEAEVHGTSGRSWCRSARRPTASRSAALVPACDVAPALVLDWMEMSWPTARARSAPTVQFSLPPSGVKGSKLKCFMALRWVMWSMSWSGRPPTDSHNVSGAMGQVESECG